MKKSVFFVLAVIFSFQMSAQNSFNLKLASKHQQQLKTTEIAGDSSQPNSFHVDVWSSIASWNMPANRSNNTPNHFNLYLNGIFIDEVLANKRSYFYDCLVYGQEYSAGITAVYDWGETDTVNFDFISHFLFSVRNFTASSAYGTGEVLLNFDPPMNCEGEIPAGLISFNIYEDWNLIGNIPYDETVFLNLNVMPGTYNYCVSAVYDLSAYGFPGETGTSVRVCDTVEVIWGFELSFIEDWSSGSFETNSWTTTSSNWKINTGEGHPAPSAEFSSDSKLEGERYTYSLTSTPFNADMLAVGDIWLDFDLKLDDINEGSTEKMWIKISNGLSWHLFYVRKNEGSFDWERIHLNISNIALGNVFQVRFEASGANSSNIQKWMIDNIEVYRICPSACNLDIEIDTVGYDEYTLHFTWEPCDSIAPPNNWIHWDNGTNFSAIGSCSCTISVAARWHGNSFPEYQGTSITKVRVYAFDEGFTSWIINIWSGENADSLLYFEDVTSQIIIGDWTEITLVTPVPYDFTKEFWVGYTADIIAGYFPLGNDSGPAITGFGDKITLDGEIWENLSDYGMDYNWNIQAYIEDFTNSEFSMYNQKKGISESDNHLNLYRSVNGGEFTLYAELDYIEGQVEYPMPIEADGNFYCYKLTAVYESGTDYCESEPFTTIDPNIDYVCVLLTDDKTQNNETAKSITIFPNPTNSQLNIQSEVEIEEITLMNAFGQVVVSRQINDKLAVLNTSALNSGIYFVKLKTGKGVFNKKIVINH